MFSDNDLFFQIPEHSILDHAKGAFAKRVAVVIRDESQSPENTDFLKKVLLAAGLDLEKDTLQLAIKHGESVSFLPLAKTKQAERILVFGILPNQIGLHINCPLYEPVQFYGVELLFAHDLDELKPDTTLKRQLWQALQQLFLNT